MAIMREVTANGLRFAVRDEGTGPAVLLLHGFPDSAALWRHQVDPLVAAGFRVVAPDLRGFGASDKPAELSAYRLATLAQDVVGILDALDVAKVSVVGHDFGAALGWLLAMTQPHRVERLAVLSVGHPGAFARVDLEQLQMSWYMFLIQQDDAEDFFTRDDWLRFRTWLAGAPDLDRYLTELAEPGRLTAGLAWYRANKVTPGRGPREYGPIRQPVLGIWGARDQTLGEPQMTGSADFVHGPWQYERIENAGHWLPLEQPEAITRLLLDFLVRAS
jgi:pimeloyl-ACP methyl ester carboxylesterase